MYDIVDALKNSAAKDDKYYKIMLEAAKVITEQRRAIEELETSTRNIPRPKASINRDTILP
tara:strand:- start:100 stop:282 length:183 start_codon:yes stop_codon:yes gene_type:complete